MPKPKTFSRDDMQAARGNMPVLQFCLPSQLEVDHTYQRSIENGESLALIADIATNWHWGRAQLLTVSRRDGRLFVVDGQHRLAAAKLRGDIQQLPCLVEEFSDVSEEAKLFDDLNDKRRPVSAIDKFRAAIVAGDTDCMAIGAAMERAGLSLAAHSNPSAWKPGQLANIGGIRSAWKTHGPAAVELALTVMSNAFKGEVLEYAGTIFPGLVAVCAGGPGDATISDEGLTLLIRALRRKTQRQWRAAVLEEMASSGVGRVVAMSFALREAMAGEGGRAEPQQIARSDVTPITAPIAGGPALGDRFDQRARGHEFCEQCDKLVSPARAKACQSAWCKLRDVAV